MKFLKKKFVGLLLVLTFVVSIFSGICVQNMDMDEGMAMVHSEMEQEHTAMDHSSIACKKACEVSTYETSRTDFFVIQDISTKFSLELNEVRLIVENIFVSQWDPPPIYAKIHTTGRHEEGIKLLI